MKKYTLETMKKMIKQGRIECITNLQIGYVTIRGNITRKITTVEVTQK